MDLSKNTIVSQIKEYYAKSSQRERIIMVLPLIFTAVLCVYWAGQRINQAFAAQRQVLAKVQEQMRLVPVALGRYSRLSARKAAIESAYREVEINEAPLAHIENLIKNKAGVGTGFTIRDRPVKEFGGNYEQAPFLVKFVTNDYAKLIDFLKELVHGQHRMLLTRLDLKKRPGGEAIDVEMDVSSMRRITKQAS